MCCNPDTKYNSIETMNQFCMDNYYLGVNLKCSFYIFAVRRRKLSQRNNPLTGPDHNGWAFFHATKRR